MTAPTFGSPFQSTIHPKGWVRPAGNFEPVVTVTFADHIALKRNPGVDVGTGRCDDVLIAQCDGVVSLAGLVGYPTPNAITIRYRSSRHPDFEPAVTHMASLGVNPRSGARWKVGDPIARGEQVGTLGMSGASACHAHVGLKQLINGVWTEVDGWPYLNQEDSMIPIPGASFAHLVNKKTSTIGPANFRAERLTSPETVIFKKFPAGTAFLPVVQADDNSTAGGATPTLWYGGLLYVGAGNVFGWFHSSVLGPLVDNEPAGHTDQDLADAAAGGRREGIKAAADAAAAAK